MEKQSITELTKLIASLKQEIPKQIVSLLMIILFNNSIFKREREKIKAELGVIVKRVGQLDLKYRNMVNYNVSNNGL